MKNLILIALLTTLFAAWQRDYTVQAENGSFQSHTTSRAFQRDLIKDSKKDIKEIFKALKPKMKKSSKLSDDGIGFFIFLGLGIIAAIIALSAESGCLVIAMIFIAAACLGLAIGLSGGL